MAASSSPVRYRVNGTQEFLLKATAAVLDIVGFLFMLLIVGEVGTEVIGMVGNILLFVWFFMLGVSFTSGNAQSKLVTMGVNALLEIVPFVNGLYPGFSVAVWRIVAIVKKEDEEKARAQAAAQESADQKRMQEVQRAQAIRAQRLAQAANDDEREREAA
jgi:hypothetical protein